MFSPKTSYGHLDCGFGKPAANFVLEDQKLLAQGFKKKVFSRSTSPQNVLLKKNIVSTTLWKIFNKCLKIVC